MLRELPRHHNHPQQQQQQQQQEEEQQQQQVKLVQLFSEVLPRQYLNKQQDLPPRWVFLSMTIITGVTMTKSKLFSIDVRAFQWL